MDSKSSRVIRSEIRKATEFLMAAKRTGNLKVESGMKEVIAGLRKDLDKILMEEISRGVSKEDVSSGKSK